MPACMHVVLLLLALLIFFSPSPSIRQNQIRLMIGGALGEARGDLMPGFVEAALKTPYKLRVPLAPAEGLVLESQVSVASGQLSRGKQ